MTYSNTSHTPIALAVPGGPPHIRTVVMHWSNQHGECSDCGLPAAYDLITHGGPPMRLCSVCAAYNVAAGNGTQLVHLFNED